MAAAREQRREQTQGKRRREYGEPDKGDFTSGSRLASGWAWTGWAHAGPRCIIIKILIN
jgi:hypothetical protein